MRNPLNLAAMAAIRGYQKASRSWASKCLHHPTCSNYGLLAYQQYPFWTATRKTWTRLRKCNPFSGLPYADYP